MSGGTAATPAIDWDDELWQLVWERNLDPVERHSIAVAVWRRRLPAGVFEAGVALELARRWRRRAVGLALLYALWTGFWGGIAWSALHDARPANHPLPYWAVAVGALLIAACFAVRRRLGRWVESVRRSSA